MVTRISGDHEPLLDAYPGIPEGRDVRCLGRGRDHLIQRVGQYDKGAGRMARNVVHAIDRIDEIGEARHVGRKIPFPQPMSDRDVAGGDDRAVDIRAASEHGSNALDGM